MLENAELEKAGKKTRKSTAKKPLTPEELAEEAHDIQMFEAKSDYLSVYCDKEVSASELYRYIFPPDTLEVKGDKTCRASNPIFSYRISDVKKAHFRNEIVFQDTFDQSLALTQGCTMALCSMISYSGRNKTAVNAYKCHGFCIDLDGVGMEELIALWGWIYQIRKIPVPTFIANSGHGLHIYYVFQLPVPLYPQVVEHLQKLKRGLTDWVWNRETSTNPDRQYQGIYQCFRMVGSCTKLGFGENKGKYLVRAWQTGGPVTIAYLNDYVDEKYKCPLNPDYSSWEWGRKHHSLREAKKLWPAWYQKRIVEKQLPKQWTCKHALYDWWFRKIQEEGNAKDGNRYHCISMLYVYGVKCQIEKSLVDADAESLLESYNALTVKKDNEFTEDDIKAASKFYDPKYAKFTKKEISRRTKIEINPTKKRNVDKHRTLAKHLERCRKLRELESYENVGAPTKLQLVYNWRTAHPTGRKIDCEKETGLSRHTVLKWWNKCPEGIDADEREMYQYFGPPLHPDAGA